MEDTTYLDAREELRRISDRILEQYIVNLEGLKNEISLLNYDSDITESLFESIVSAIIDIGITKDTSNEEFINRFMSRVRLELDYELYKKRIIIDNTSDIIDSIVYKDIVLHFESLEAGFIAPISDIFMNILDTPYIAMLEIGVSVLIIRLRDEN